MNQRFDIPIDYQSLLVLTVPPFLSELTYQIKECCDSAELIGKSGKPKAAAAAAAPKKAAAPAASKPAAAKPAAAGGSKPAAAKKVKRIKYIKC